MPLCRASFPTYSLIIKAILPIFIIRITYDTIISLRGTKEKKVVYIRASVPKAYCNESYH